MVARLSENHLLDKTFTVGDYSIGRYSFLQLLCKNILYKAYFIDNELLNEDYSQKHCP